MTDIQERRIEDRVRRRLREKRLWVVKSRRDATYSIVNDHNFVIGGPGMSLDAVVAFADDGCGDTVTMKIDH